MNSTSSTPTPPSTTTSADSSKSIPKEIKKANKPFLVHQKWKAKQEAAAASASSLAIGGGSNDSGSILGMIIWNVLKWTVIGLLSSSLISKVVTETWLWEYDGKWSKPGVMIKRMFPPKPRVLGEVELALHDGTNPEKYPLYLGIDGDVYDVSNNMAMYGPGGSYNIFAGKDAARAYATGCFKTHLTHDLRGFGDKEMKSLAHWKKFFAESTKYYRVGKIVHPPIDPHSPIPPPCDARKEGGAI